VEEYLEKTAGRYCVGDAVTLADVCLVPQVYNAHRCVSVTDGDMLMAYRFNVDMDAFPLIVRIDQALGELEPFQRAHPSRQPDAV
jgi:glutathione S-transferase